MMQEVFASTYEFIKITATILYLKTVKNDVMYLPMFKFSQVITPRIPQDDAIIWDTKERGSRK
jgi:hypothetical protein